MDLSRTFTAIGSRGGCIGFSSVWPPKHRTANDSCTAPRNRRSGLGSDERAANKPMAELISTFVWQPIGAEHDAEILCDSLGLPCTTGACVPPRATWRGSARRCSTAVPYQTRDS